MKRLLFPLIALLVISCHPKVYPLQGNYSNKATIKTQKSFDVVWENIIQTLSKNNISILLNEKSIGQIQTEKMQLINHYCYEINGKPVDSTAWLVLSNSRFAHNVIDPKNITGEWYIKVEKLDVGCLVSIILTNIDAHSYPPLSGESTGVFEKLIADKVK